MKPLSRIDYRKVGHVCIYHGHMGAGLTLAAVRHAVSLHKQTGMPIVSNIRLYKVAHKMLDVESLLQTTNSIVLLDNVWLYLNNRREAEAAPLLSRYMTLARHQNNKYVLVCHNLEDLLPRVRKSTSTTFLCNYIRSKRPALILWRKDVHLSKLRCYRLNNVDRIFKYYNTVDIPVALRLFKNAIARDVIYGDRES